MVGAYAVTQGGDAGFGFTTANVWAIPNASPNGTCSRNATPETLAAAEAALRVCNPADYSGGAIAAAYVAANIGDDVGIDGGTYAAQTILAAQSKASGSECDPVYSTSTLTAGSYPIVTSNFADCIVFKPQAGEAVSIGGWAVEGRYTYLNGSDAAFGESSLITLTGNIELGTSATCATAHDNVVSGVATKLAFFMRGSNSAIINSDFNLGDAYLRSVVSQFNGTCPPTKNLVQHNRFRNLLQYQKSDQTGSVGENQMHIEAIHLRIGADIIISGNKFLNNAQYGLSAQSDSGAITNLKVVNNVFDKICSGQPAGTIVSSGTFASGSNVITSVSSTAGFTAGQGVYSIYLPYTNNIDGPPTVPTIVSTTANSITLSANATGSQTSNFTVGGSSCTGNRGLQLTGGNTFSDPLIAFNTFYDEREGYDTGPGAITAAKSYGNIRVALGSFFCPGTVTQSYLVNANDFSTSAGSPPDNTCGTGSVTGAADLKDPANYDFRIGVSSAANNLVPSGFASGVPTVDIRGNTRSGALLDAGAYDSTASAP